MGVLYSCHAADAVSRRGKTPGNVTGDGEHGTSRVVWGTSYQALLQPPVVDFSVANLGIRRDIAVHSAPLLRVGVLSNTILRLVVIQGEITGVVVPRLLIIA